MSLWDYRSRTWMRKAWQVWYRAIILLLHESRKSPILQVLDSVTHSAPSSLPRVVAPRRSPHAASISGATFRLYRRDTLEWSSFVRSPGSRPPRSRAMTSRERGQVEFWCG